MLFDSGITLFSQPSSYWHHPITLLAGHGFTTVLEHNGLVRYVLGQGVSVYVLASLFYILVVFWLISILPRRLALVGVFSFILAHYHGASTWLSYYWHFGTNASIIYGIILGLVFVHLLFSVPDKASPDKSMSNEADA